jgi:uncharacterized membrane protein HdeD (DUF308 family)
MSTAPDSPPPIPPGPPPAQRHGCATAIMVIFGIILLLPGLCAILFGVGALADHSSDPTLVVLVVIGIAVGFAGIMLIREAIRGPRM